MPQINLPNNLSLYYESHGDGDETIVLIGGLSADHNVWRSPLRTFLKHFRVIIFDNRGSGQSSTPDEPYTTEMMANDTAALMEALAIKNAHVIGHSMGGCVTQQLIIHHPDRIKKAVITCSRHAPSRLADMALSIRAKLMDMNVDHKLLAEYMMPYLFSEQFLQQVGNVKGFIQWTIQNPHPQSTLGFKRQLHAVITHDVSEQINLINKPTLVITGEEDVLMPAKIGQAFADLLPDSKYVCIPNSGHMPHVEQSPLFVDAVMSFLHTLGT